ncbi:hypothetical protein [Pseudodesulfovibrio pelocollis]|uniref:hypothetical protein n=1 Tax=Pseudodesulfovibrio pelocollis TaxID=3051432 RepID=UPI00255AEB73|nr:hypothetical protein [Pseudodesulfovibrio sp. SB368]
MARTVHEAAKAFMEEVLWRAEIAPVLRRLGVRTDRAVEGPRRGKGGGLTGAERRALDGRGGR